MFPFRKLEQYNRYCSLLLGYSKTEECVLAMQEMNLQNIFLWNLFLVKNDWLRDGLLNLRTTSKVWSPDQVPPVFLPGLPSKKKYQAWEVKIADFLIEHVDIFEKEFHEFFEKKNRTLKPYIDESSVLNDSWKTVFLYMQGQEVIEQTKAFPKTMKVLNAISGLSMGFLLFSVLEPGAKIAEHTGPINGILRLHIPLIVPGGDCFIDIAGQKIQWKKGEPLIFDDSFRHQAVNNTGKARVILLVSVYNPYLTSQQLKYLVELEKLLFETELSVNWVSNNMRIQG